MDRKKFIKSTTATIGLACTPIISFGKTIVATTTSFLEERPKIIKAAEGNILNVIGDIQTHKISGKDTNNQIVEWVNNVAPGVGIPPHVHTKEDEIFRIMKGSVELSVGEKTVILKAGDIAFAPRNVAHTWKIVGNENASMSTSAFPAGIEIMFKELSKLPPGPPEFDKVAEICSKYGISFV